MIDLNASNSKDFVTVTKLADESRASTTTANDAELLFAAEANSWYGLEMYLTVTGVATFAGLRLLINLPSGAEAVVTGRSNVNTTISNINNGNVIAALIPAASMLTSQMVHVFAKVKTTNAGNIVLSWAQNTTDAINLTTVKAGSILSFIKIN